MRKISLVLAALLGLSGVAYGAGWVQTKNTPEIKEWLAPGPSAYQLWQKVQYAKPQKILDGQSYDKVLELSQADCKKGWLKSVQSILYLHGQIVPITLPTSPFYPPPGTGGAQILHMLCRKH